MLKEQVYNRLKQASKKNPMDRRYYALVTGSSERAVRKAISVLRNEGVRVCATSHGYGYWIAKDEEEYNAFRGEYMSRANEIMKTVKAMDDAGEKQISIFRALGELFKR